jgi:hypothetical protein
VPEGAGVLSFRSQLSSTAGPRSRGSRCTTGRSHSNQQVPNHHSGFLSPQQQQQQQRPSTDSSTECGCFWRCAEVVCCVLCCSAAKQLAGNYGFDPLYLAAKDEESFKW